MSGRRVRPMPAPALVSSQDGPATDPLVQLVEHQASLAEALEHERQLILACRRRGYTWRLIGAAAGVTPQAAEQRAKRAKQRATAP